MQTNIQMKWQPLKAVSSMVVQNIGQSPSCYQGLPCFLPTSPATALFGWCSRHELNIQSMVPTLPQTQLALVARSSANSTPTANPLPANLFSLLAKLQNKSVISWRPVSLAAKLNKGYAVCTEGRKKKVKTVDVCLLAAKNSFVPLKSFSGVPYPSLTVKRIFGPAGEVAAAEISVFGNRSWNRGWD